MNSTIYHVFTTTTEEKILTHPKSYIENNAAKLFSVVHIHLMSQVEFLMYRSFFLHCLPCLFFKRYSLIERWYNFYGSERCHEVCGVRTPVTSLINL